jgi:hypothetical protein
VKQNIDASEDCDVLRSSKCSLAFLDKWRFTFASAADADFEWIAPFLQPIIEILEVLRKTLIIPFIFHLN